MLLGEVRFEEITLSECVGRGGSGVVYKVHTAAWPLGDASSWNAELLSKHQNHRFLRRSDLVATASSDTCAPKFAPTPYD